MLTLVAIRIQGFYVPAPNRRGHWAMLLSDVYLSRLSIFWRGWIIMPLPHSGGIKRWCASDVCLSRTSGISREQRGLGRPKLAQIQTPLLSSKVKVTRPLLSAALTLNAAAAVSVGKYFYVASARQRARRLGANGGGAVGHIVSPRAQPV